MFIVIEGSDGSGKSSLVDEIESQLAGKYPDHHITKYHKGRPEEESRLWVLNDWVMSIEHINWFDSVAVADRWHWGEATYAPLKRPHTCNDSFGLLGVSGWRWTELFMASRGIAQFWLYQPLEVIQSRISVRGDDFVNIQELEKIVALYTKTSREVLGLTATLTPRADSASTTPLLAQFVISEAEKVHDAAKKLAQFKEYIGPPNPKVLLIGDKPGGANPPTILPFLPINKNSGEFLMEALPEDLWREVGIINASDFTMRRFLLLLEALGHPKVIALGRIAERLPMSAGLTDTEYRVVAHPQYVRRFHHHDRIAYGEAIARLAFTNERTDDPWVLR